MRFPRLLCVSAGLALWLGGTVSAQSDCAPLGKVQFICNVISPEDFALVPGTDWMITSGNRAGGGKEIWIGTNRGNRIGYFPAP